MARFTLDELKALTERYSEEAVSLLQTAVRIPSPTGQEKGCSDFFAGELNRLGLEVNTYAYEENRPNVVAKWKGGEGGKNFLFNGHMDVITPPDGIRGGFDPWSGEIRDGRLYACGSTDMKAGDCAALMAIRILKENGFVPKGCVTVSYVVDEQISSRMGALALLKDGLINDGDYGISMEPSDGGIILQEGGIWNIEISYYGAGGHTTTKDAKMDALQKAVTAISRFYELKAKVESVSYPLLGKPYLQINTIQAGTALNSRPRLCTFSLDRRYAAEEGFETARGQIMEILESLAAENPEMADYELKEVGFYPATKRDESSSAVRACMQAFEEVRGEAPERIGIYGGSDAQHIMAATPVQMPRFGPGYRDQECRPDESVALKDYLDMITIYMRVLDMLM